ncbi:STAS domain-containing protein [Litorilituus sediminis]|nr:STAS domain-containing protein [Litorilituus sediminis]
MKSVTFAVNGSNVNVSGELTRHTVMQVANKELKSVFSHNAVELDFSQVTHVDTAGLAWLFLLLEQAATHNCQLTFQGLPKKLDKLIELSGVQGLLPV